MRWLIKQAVIREPTFGGTRRDVLGWTVQPYVTLGDGSRQFLNRPVPFPGISAARRYATGEAHRFTVAARRRAWAARNLEAVAS